jgi:hypothetical protein
LERYGTKTATGNKDVAQKISETKLRYDESTKRDIRNKVKATCLERYGVENPAQTEEHREKYVKTSLERYGTANPAQTEIVKDKFRATCLERYGGPNPMSSAEVRERSKVRSSKEQRKHWVESLPWLLGYDENGDWICKCPHPDCNQCSEKFYIVQNYIYQSRAKNQTEPCTWILPVGKYTRLNTCEIFIASILKGVGIEPKSDRSILNGYELDFYIPDHNLAIEVNGCWWHSDVVKTANYHFDKFKNCQSQHIQLIQIWEDWIKTKPEIVRSMILNKLGFSERIWARKCGVIELKSTTEFLNKNHIQGQTPAAIKLGLTYNGELVSVMCFNKRSKLSGSKTVNDGEWELIRFCNKLNTSVVGAAGKLLKYFINKYHPQLITSFSLNDISDGNLYKKLGFKQGSCSCSYWYVNKFTYQRFHRSAFTKKRIKELGLAPDKENWTEREAMGHSAYYRIQDSGMTKWVLNIII